MSISPVKGNDPANWPYPYNPAISPAVPANGLSSLPDLSTLRAVIDARSATVGTVLTVIIDTGQAQQWVLLTASNADDGINWVRPNNYTTMVWHRAA
jgi:hypothetical protein